MTTHTFDPRFLSNPFLPAPGAPAASLAFAPAAPDAFGEREPQFALVQSGPAVSADEVESHVDAVEVTARWGTQILTVAHLVNGKSFWVGEGSDLALPEDVLGGSRAPIVVSRDGGTYVVVPRGSQGVVATRGAAPETLASLLGRNALSKSTELDQAHEIALAYGMSVTLEVGAVRGDGTTGEPITFEIKTVRAGKVAPVGFLASLAGGATGFVGLSFLGHAAIVASLAMFMPKMNDDSEGIDRDQMMLMQKMLTASAERETEAPKEVAGATTETGGGGSTGQAHQGESGAAGTTRAVTTNGRMGFKGSERTSTVSRAEELREATEWGMVSLILKEADPNAPTSRWAVDFHGADEKSAVGAMFSSTIDDAAGYGFGMLGTGSGGGGLGAGVGLDHVGTVGGGAGGTGPWGLGPGDKGGHGIGHGPGQNGHIVKAPMLRNPKIESNGRLPEEVIQRIVRQNFGRFRLCYEGGLRSNPGLTGRVATKFVIGRDGAVAQSSDAGSDLPDQQVVACIVRSFHSLSFPSPEGGIATVTYPIILTPGQ